LIFSVTMGTMLKVQANFDDDYSNYDSIVRELSTSRLENNNQPPQPDAFDLVVFHMGFSLLNSQLSVDLPGKLPSSIMLAGFEARFGIDLFSRNWEAIGSVRSFNPETKNSIEYKLQEFDLLLSYKSRLSKALEYTLGAGMAARYLDITGNKPEGVQDSYTTPSTVFLTGLNFYLTRAFSTGVLLSYRSPMIDDTIDEGAVDGAFSVQGHF
jgi:hypothetical protein